MTIKQFVEIDAFENVHGFVKAEALPERAGFNYEEVNPPEPHFPARPFPKAILRRARGANYWYDPRTESDKSADVRAARNLLLAQSDWVVTRASEQRKQVPVDWSNYRQELREIPQKAGFPINVNWPAPPALGKS